MKKIIILTLCFAAVLSANAQLKITPVCPQVTVDILKGRVNDLLIGSTVAQVKKQLPCFTTAEDESATAKCGGGVFYKDKDFYFYTARDYVEIGPAFKGKLSIPLMGASRTALFKWLGNPKIKDVNWDAFETAYGLLILNYTKAGKINKIQMTIQSAETVNLCQ